MTREEIRPHIRDERPSTSDVVIVRGGPDTLAKLATHARRTHRAYCLDGSPLWGVSVFCALDATGPASLIGLLSGRVSTYRAVHTPTAGHIEEAGFTLLPTFARPHYTLRLHAAGHNDLERLLAALGAPRENPYHRLAERRARRDPR
jgi:hypothetical protein